MRYVSAAISDITTMHSHHYLRAQTELAESFLSELAQVGSISVVNFNNTKQFDTFLRHLEISLQTSPFCSPPSVTVLHILITLAARCHNSFWSHDSLRSPVIEDTTEYMRQVNSEYDSSLYKPSLQQRSAHILSTYVDLIKNAHSHRAIETLRRHLQAAFSSLLKSDITSFLQRKPTKSSVASENTRSPSMSIEPAVEVISDSEESDSLLEMPTSDDALAKSTIAGPSASVTSFFDLGSKTSGLGETGVLFKEMPHLSNQATPEPDAVESRAKRENEFSLSKIQIFDDALLYSKLQQPATYDMWNLYKWMCWCADMSSQYQTFLFNSSSTTVHHIYTSYESFFSVLIEYCQTQFVQNAQKADLILPKLLQLRAGSHERVVEHIFYGLGVPSYDKPFPCYNRETILMKQDPATQVSRCKESVSFDDNEHSLGLRLRLLNLLLHYEYVWKSDQVDQEFDVKSWPDKKLVSYTVEKVIALPLRYFQAFFRTYTSLPGQSDFSWEVYKRVCLRILWSITGYEPLKLAKSMDFSELLNLLEKPSTYTGITEDVGIKSWDEFNDKWTRLQFLLEWLLIAEASTGGTAGLGHDQVIFRGRNADRVMSSCYCEFVDGRSDDADLIEDVTFTFTALEAKQHKDSLKCQFEEILQML